MNVTRDIVKDLLPLHVAGEASADSSALVESFLKDDPELARLADALRAANALPAFASASRAQGAGRLALNRTRRLLRRRTRLLAFALLFTGLPLSFAFDGHRVQFLLLRDVPGLASASLAVAVAMWIAFGVTARRLRVSGL